ncbi:DUF968 domain-containing protein [Tsuneonella deserti]|uniref:DUF968 domain-containing protein n=1 Tax=Tsuneonella deserti TaxID=2035528 RepID=UPI00166753B6|nr:putative HNHc nuclease [Tsuneonella deserti]
MASVRLPARIKRPRNRLPRRSCPAHCAWVRRHRCCVPGCKNLPTECAHVRSGTDGGTGLKPSDRWTISLCRAHHAEQHRIGEAAFEACYTIDLKAVAERFAQASPHWLKLEAPGEPI